MFASEREIVRSYLGRFGHLRKDEMLKDLDSKFQEIYDAKFPEIVDRFKLKFQSNPDQSKNAYMSKHVYDLDGVGFSFYYHDEVKFFYRGISRFDGQNDYDVIEAILIAMFSMCPESKRVFINPIHYKINQDFENPPKHHNSRCRIVFNEKAGESKMNFNEENKTKNIVSLMVPGIKTVAVTFNKESQDYTYKTTLDLEEGDLVVVDARGSYTVAQVSKVHEVPQIDVDSNIVFKWVVSKVDDSAYKEGVAAEEKFANELLNVQQKKVVENASALLAEHLGISKDDVLALQSKMENDSEE